MTIRVNYGAGWQSGANWQCYDASPSVRLERLPVIGRFIRVNGRRFPEEIRVGDIVRGLPVAPSSVSSVYASHVLEHLSYSDALMALKNTYAMMAPGGVFRLIVPDLTARAERYLAAAQCGDPAASARFMRETFLGQEARPRGVFAMVKAAMGNSAHLWMWDEASMSDALRWAGFVAVRRCELGDAADPAFAEVEAANRFRNEDIDVPEVALEARKPDA